MNTRRSQRFGPTAQEYIAYLYRHTLECSSSVVDIARQRHDHDVRQRASSYKSVTHSNSSDSTTSFGFLDHDDVNVVVDLGVVPGGWSQVAAFGVRAR